MKLRLKQRVLLSSVHSEQFVGEDDLRPDFAEEEKLVSSVAALFYLVLQAHDFVYRTLIFGQ